MLRPSPSALFLCGAVALTVAVFALAKNAAGDDRVGKSAGGLPSDASELGFVAVGPSVQGVALLDVTRPFRVELGHGPVHGVRPSAARLMTARALVARELGRYPSTFLNAAHLHGVVLADDLQEGDTPIPSLPNVAGLLLLDVNGTESDLVRGLHHEIFHFVDLADDGSLSPDARWDALNSRGFAYGAGGRTLRSAWAARPPEGDGFVSGGFVSSYATSGVEEDKAETFAFLMARPAETRARAEHDPTLAAKLGEMARRVGALSPQAERQLGLTR